MRQIFRIVYRGEIDTRRTTNFFEAERTEHGFKVYLPETFKEKAIHLESVSIFDADLIPEPVKHSPTEAAKEWAQKEVERIQREKDAP